MWLDLQKPSTYAHNDKAQFSLPFDSLIHKLTNHHWHTTKRKQVCFCWDCFLRHVRHTIVLAWPWNGCGSLNKQAVGQRSANYWQLLLSIDLATFYDISNATGLHLSPFGGPTSSRVFTHHCCGSPPPPTNHPMWALVVLMKNYLKWWVIQPATHWRVHQLKYHR